MPSRIKSLGSEALEQQVAQLAGQLRQRRKVLGVSVPNAAAAAGMSRDTWYRMERGETTVTIGAWFNALAAVGLRFCLGRAPDEATPADSESIALNIRLVDHPQLAALAWQLNDRATLSPREAHDIYERNARHIDQQDLTERERSLIRNLRKLFA